MSTTLTWALSGNCTKTGTTAQTLLDDLDTLISSFSGNAAFSWQKAGKASGATTPAYLLLSRKDGSAGRIAIMIFTTAPTNINPTIFDQLAVQNNVFIAWFPNGTGTTLSNLNATSGTICGNDTGAVKACATSIVSTVYAASLVSFYFDSYDGMWFGFANPGAAATYAMAAGALVEDAAGVAYDACAGFGNISMAQWGSSSSSALAWLAATPNAGSATAALRTNYGSSNRCYFAAWVPSGPWANQLHSASTDILADDPNSKVWFAPYPLLGQTKGEGVVLKFRQIGFGTGTTNAFATYSTTGPVVQATQFCNVTAGGSGYPWMTNFKI